MEWRSAHTAKALLMLSLFMSASTSAQEFSWEVRSGTLRGSPAAILPLASGDILFGSDLQAYRLQRDALGWTATLAQDLPSAHAFFVAADGILLAGSYHGVYRSTDQGMTWGWSDLLDLDVRCFLRTSTGAILAGTYHNGVYRSTDEGRTWSWTGATLVWRFVVDLVLHPNGNIYAVNYSGGHTTGLSCSSDDGVTWDTLETEGVAYNPSRSYTFRSMAITPSGKMFLGCDGFILTSVDGRFWSLLNETAVTMPSVGVCRDLSITPEGAVVVASPEGGVYASVDDGVNWAPIIPASYQPTAVLADSNGRIYAATLDGICVTSDRAGEIESTVLAVQGWGGTILNAGHHHLYCGFPNGRLYLTLNDGVTWDRIPSLPEGSSADLVTAADSLVVLGGSIISLSTNGGRTWTTAAPDSVTSYYYPKLITHDRTIVVANSSLHVYCTTDLGGTWTMKALPVSSAEGAMVEYPVGTLVAGDVDRVFRSHDLGDSWDIDSVGTDGYVIRSLAVDPTGSVYGAAETRLVRSPGASSPFVGVPTSGYVAFIHGMVVNQQGDLFIRHGGRYDHISRSTDQGWTWNDVGPGERAVYGMTLDDAQRLYAATDSGVYRTISSTTGVEHLASSTLPRSTALAQNFPNPFNGTTTFSIHVPTRMWLSLVVYDLLGREVTVLRQGEEVAGDVRVQWDAEAFASGVYVARLSLEERGSIRSESRRCILLK
jgi:hypothetical protein